MVGYARIELINSMRGPGRANPPYRVWE